jgi:hypothetical protein
MKIILLFVVLTVSPFISLRAQNPSEILSPEKILQLLPKKIQGFHISKNPSSKVIKLGTLRYAMAEKNFAANHKRSVKILLFDYKEAPIMYNQATRKWSTYTAIETDSIIQRPYVMKDCTGWESNNVKRKNSQIILGIYNRFYLTIEGTNVDLESLQKVVQTFMFEAFPK